MRVEQFRAEDEFSATPCPRCHSVGFTEIDWDTYRATPDKDRHENRYLMCPSVYCRCPACGLVAELGGLRMEQPEED